MNMNNKHASNKKHCNKIKLKQKPHVNQNLSKVHNFLNNNKNKEAIQDYQQMNTNNKLHFNNTKNYKHYDNNDRQQINIDNNITNNQQQHCKGDTTIKKQQHCRSTTNNTMLNLKQHGNITNNTTITNNITTNNKQLCNNITRTQLPRKRKYNWKEEKLLKEQDSKKFKGQLRSSNAPAEIWFDDVDEILIESTRNHVTTNNATTTTKSATNTHRSTPVHHNTTHHTTTRNTTRYNAHHLATYATKHHTTKHNTTTHKVLTSQNAQLNNTTTNSQSATKKVSLLMQQDSNNKLTKVLGMDCEMVGVGRGGTDSILARVSIVNQYGHCVYDKHVKPREKVTDYRTRVSGVRPSDLEMGEDFKVVQKEVCEMLENRILVGHAIDHDLKVLFLDHPHSMIRDTSKFQPFRAVVGGGIPSLKKLSDRLLGVTIQEGEHDSIQDAQATMRLYTLHRKRWEESLKGRKIFRGKRRKMKMVVEGEGGNGKPMNEKK